MSAAFYELDKEATLNSLNKKDIINSLSIEDVARFLESLGVEVDRFENHLICPTICHNRLEDAESRKLYWYHNYKVFHCYTECSESMSIFELYKRYMSLNEYEIDDFEAELYVRQFLTNITITKKNNGNHLELNKEKYLITNIAQELYEYPKSVLSYFMKYYHPLWLREGISKKSMDNFNILFSIAQNKIIIPHFDIDGRLVGIRGRALEKKDIENGKYRPVLIGDTLYAHQLQFNLYGLYQHKKAIQKYRRAIIFEGEKSCLKDETFYGDDSVAVACCGSNINKYQIGLLIKNFGVNEIIIAFDKEYETIKSQQAKKYRQKIVDICNKYKHLASFSYIFDEKDLLEEKDSPNDKGQEIFEQLYKERIKVRW